MTVQNASIAGIVAGNDLDVNRTVPGIPNGQTLAKAWLTFKSNLAAGDPGLLQKLILPGAVAGQGQITDVGGTGTAQLLFQLSKTDTAALPVDTPTPYDVTVLTSTGKVYTTEKGLYLATAGVTKSNS